MNTPYSFLPAKPQDRESIVTLLGSVNLPAEDLPQPLDTFLIATESGKVAGSVGLELYKEYALLRSLAVAPAQQGTGLGKVLYQQAMQLAAEQGVKEVYLITATAALFFEKQGFTEVERAVVPVAIQKTAQFSSICPASATIMQKQIH